jgi:hypothetical protein
MLTALLAGCVLFGTLGLRLTTRLTLTGDEPWYAAQAYALWHFHTPAIFTPHVPRAVYEPLLGGTPDDHTRDYLGNGERLLVNLPGYAAIIAPFFALVAARWSCCSRRWWRRQPVRCSWARRGASSARVW